MSIKQEKRIRRHRKIRINIHGTKDCPRLCVWRSNQHIYAQLINDESGKVLAQVSDVGLKVKKADKKTDVAKEKAKPEVAKEAAAPEGKPGAAKAEVKKEADPNKEFVDGIMAEMALKGASKKRLIKMLGEQFNFDKHKVMFRLKRALISERYAAAHAEAGH